MAERKQQSRNNFDPFVDTYFISLQSISCIDQALQYFIRVSIINLNWIIRLNQIDWILLIHCSVIFSLKWIICCMHAHITQRFKIIIFTYLYLCTSILLLFKRRLSKRLMTNNKNCSVMLLGSKNFWSTWTLKTILLL